MTYQASIANKERRVLRSTSKVQPTIRPNKKTAFAKNREIERLRAVAVIMVTIAHGIMTSILPIFMYFSFYGVDLFFAISGFVVTLSFLRLTPEIENNSSFWLRIENSRKILQIFYIKRIFRIWPLATFWMFVFLFLSIYYGGNFSTPLNTFWDIMGVFTGFYNYLVSYGYPGNIGHYWSLATEMQFYLFLPVFLIVFAKKSTRLRSIFVILGLFLLLFLLFLLHPRGIIKYVYQQRYFTLLFGVLLAVEFDSPSKVSEWIQLQILQYRTIFKFIIVPILLISLWLIPGFTNPDYFNGVGFIVAGLTVASLVFIASKKQELVLNIPILRNILEYIGSRSYCIYLCHLHFVRLRPTLISQYDHSLPEWFKTGTSGLTLQYIMIWIGMIIVSEIAYRCIEVPFINLGQAYILQNLSGKQVRS